MPQDGAPKKKPRPMMKLKIADPHSQGENEGPKLSLASGFSLPADLPKDEETKKGEQNR
jgi:hypothetical protein